MLTDAELVSMLLSAPRLAAHLPSPNLDST